MLFIAFLGLSTLPHIDPATKEFFPPSANVDYWIRWANWDGGHFRGIAENNYLPQQTVFFPLYPMLIKFLMFFNIHSLWGGLILSNLSLIFSLFFLYKLTLLDFSSKIAQKTVFTLLIFPTSFYLGAVYSESLFLLLTLSCFYFMRTNKMFWAILLGAGAVATRLVGIIVFFSLINYKKIFSVKNLLITLMLLPIPIYMLFQQVLFQNLFGFLTNELSWQRHLTFPLKPVLSYGKYLILTGWQIGNMPRALIEFLFFLGGLVGLYFSFKKLPLSYSIYFLVSLILPTFSGTLVAMPRYLLTIFPLFILLGLIENEILQKLWVFFSILLLAAYTILFINWYWVT